MEPLPTSLEREPLVDAVFEMRLASAHPLGDILPGFLLHDLGEGTRVSRLPAADIPQPMRKDDPNLQFTPVQRIDVEGFSILVGDRNIVISCTLPYPKWPNFKMAIIDIISRIGKLGLPGEVERYSLKYVNLLQAPTFEEQIEKIEMSVRLGNLEVTKEHVSLQVHEREEDTVHILSITTGANGHIDGKAVTGALVDIDSIRHAKFPDVRSFSEGVEKGLESLRQKNKEKFFSCLKFSTIQEMGPTYE